MRNRTVTPREALLTTPKIFKNPVEKHNLEKRHREREREREREESILNGHAVSFEHHFHTLSH